MAHVDPGDDTVWRCIVSHHRYDEGRREWSDVVVAAFDNQREQHVEMERLHREVMTAVAAGRADPRETVSGTSRQPGYHAAQARARLVNRAIRHGVGGATILRLASSGPLPASMLLAGSADGEPFCLGGGEPPDPPWDPPGP